MNDAQYRSNEHMASTTFGVFWGIILAVIVLFVAVPIAGCIGCSICIAAAGAGVSSTQVAMDRGAEKQKQKCRDDCEQAYQAYTEDKDYSAFVGNCKLNCER